MFKRMLCLAIGVLFLCPGLAAGERAGKLIVDDAGPFEVLHYTDDDYRYLTILSSGSVTATITIPVAHQPPSVIAYSDRIELTAPSGTSFNEPECIPDKISDCWISSNDVTCICLYDPSTWCDTTNTSTLEPTVSSFTLGSNGC